MINIKIEKLYNFISSYKCEGHSDNHHICGAVSCLQRTYVDCLIKILNLDVKITAPHKGFFNFKVTNTKNTCLQLKTLTDFFIKGLIDISNEYTKECEIEFN